MSARLLGCGDVSGVHFAFSFFVTVSGCLVSGCLSTVKVKVTLSSAMNLSEGWYSNWFELIFLSSPFVLSSAVPLTSSFFGSVSTLIVNCLLSVISFEPEGSMVNLGAFFASAGASAVFSFMLRFRGGVLMSGRSTKLKTRATSFSASSEGVYSNLLYCGWLSLPLGSP